jgi:hypothetical protein
MLVVGDPVKDPLEFTKIPGPKVIDADHSKNSLKMAENESKIVDLYIESRKVRKGGAFYSITGHPSNPVGI